MATKKASASGRQECPDCHGRGIVAWGTDDVKCARCKGKGTVAVSKSASKDRG